MAWGVPQEEIARLQAFVASCHKEGWAEKNAAVPVETEHALRELGLACFDAAHEVRAKW